MDQHNDHEQFLNALRATLDFYERRPSSEALTLWWRTLEQYPLADVKAGLQSHLQDPDRGRWAPKPADVISHIEARQSSQWPGSDEAWSTALLAMDDDETVVWNDEIASAWGVARPIAQAGDEVGARMAFRDAYRREVRAAVEEGRSPRVRVSAGHDPDLRRDAINQAEERGLISHQQAQHLLPAPDEGMAPEVAGLLGGNVVEHPSAEQAKERLQGIRDLLGGNSHSGQIEETEEIERRRAAAKAAAQRSEA